MLLKGFRGVLALHPLQPITSTVEFYGLHLRKLAPISSSVKPESPYRRATSAYCLPMGSRGRKRVPKASKVRQIHLGWNLRKLEIMSWKEWVRSDLTKSLLFLRRFPYREMTKLIKWNKNASMPSSATVRLTFR